MIFHTLRFRLFLTILLLTLGTAVVAPKTYAGYWTVTAVGNGTSSVNGQVTPWFLNGFDGINNGGTYIICGYPAGYVYPYTLTTEPVNSGAGDGPPTYLQDGSAQFNFVWNSLNGGLPDTEINAQVYCVTRMYDPYNYTASLSLSGDGLGDPTLGNGVASYVNYVGASVSCIGSKVFTIDNSQRLFSVSLKLPSVSMIAHGIGVYTQYYAAVRVVYPVQATSTAGTTDPESPTWFSGTACTATGTADLETMYGINPLLNPNSITDTTPPGDYITSATLSVGGTVVKRYPEDYVSIVQMTHVTSVPNMAAMFDSSHFPDGTPITVEVEVHDALGKSYKARLSAPAYNKALVLANNTVDNVFNTSTIDTWQHVTSVAGMMNHSVTSSEFYHQSDILAAIPKNTAFYIATHGASDQFGDCYATPDSDSDTAITPGDLIPTIQLKKAYINSAPPYNFVQLDSCEAGTNALANPFLYGVNGEQSPLVATDRAFLGFLDPVQISGHNGDWTERVWNYLSQGSTLANAVKISSLNGDPLGGSLFDQPLGLFSHVITPVIHGDGAMTLHGVYGGVVTNDGLGGVDSPWYRPL